MIRFLLYFEGFSDGCNRKRRIKDDVTLRFLASITDRAELSSMEIGRLTLEVRKVSSSVRNMTGNSNGIVKQLDMSLELR